MNEVWKDIPEYEGKYQVSNLGRVRSMERFGSDGRHISEKILKPLPLESGYLLVGLGKKGLIKMYYLHRLVAIAFVPGRKEGYEVNHINEDKADCRACNLEWVDHITNIRHGTGIARRLQNTRAKKPCECRPLKDQEWKKYPSAADAARELGLSIVQVRRACCRKIVYVGYEWRYTNQ